MINGLPGNVAVVIASHLLRDQRFAVLPWSLTGPEIESESFHLGETNFNLIRPDEREQKMTAVLRTEKQFITVDFTHPSAVNANASFYCQYNLPFVMGTTGGDHVKLVRTVENSSIAAVIAPNMAKQIVGFQAMMAFAAEQFPNLFKGYNLTVRESHQAGKADTSGTAKEMVRYFNQMGISFQTEEIQKERDPERQCNLWGIAPQYLTGHGWHTYTIISADQTVKFEFTHNINGRDIYAEGTMDAVIFLAKQSAQGVKSVVFSMIDVLKGS